MFIVTGGLFAALSFFMPGVLAGTYDGIRISQTVMTRALEMFASGVLLYGGCALIVGVVCGLVAFVLKKLLRGGQGVKSKASVPLVVTVLAVQIVCVACVLVYAAGLP